MGPSSSLPWDGKFPLWAAVLCHFIAVSEAAVPATVCNADVAPCSGQSGHRAGAPVHPPCVECLQPCLRPDLGASYRPVSWAGCPLLLTLFVSVWLASHLESGTS